MCQPDKTRGAADPVGRSNSAPASTISGTKALTGNEVFRCGAAPGDDGGCDAMKLVNRTFDELQGAPYWAIQTGS